MFITFDPDMARPRNKSIIQVPPRIAGMRPMDSKVAHEDAIQFNTEEYECVRLLDYEGLSQADAARYMKISRPTLTRIYLRARKKIAAAFVESRTIVMASGNSELQGEWFACLHCESQFTVLPATVPATCPLCSSQRIKILV